MTHQASPVSILDSSSPVGDKTSDLSTGKAREVDALGPALL